MRILVTGGAGFIGSHVADALLAAGHDVAVLDNLSTGLRENVPQGATLFHRSLIDCYSTLREVRPEVVYHLAAQSNYRVGIYQPDDDARTNVLGTIHLLEMCAKVGGVRKVVYASTGGGVYGNPEYLPIDERHPTRPLVPYGISKLAGEGYVRWAAKRHGWEWAVLRLGNVYGPRQRPDGEAGVVSIFAGQVARGEPVRINGDGEQTRDFVYVTDVARAFALALGQAWGETLNIGTGRETSINHIHELVQLVYSQGTDSGARPQYVPAVPGEPRRIVLDYTRAEAELGWRPRVLLPDGVRATVEWVRESIAMAGGNE